MAVTASKNLVKYTGKVMSRKAGVPVTVAFMDRWTEPSYEGYGYERVKVTVEVEQVIFDCGNGWGVSAVRGRKGQYASRVMGTWELGLFAMGRQAKCETRGAFDMADTRDNVPYSSSFARNNESYKDECDPIELSMVDVIGYQNSNEIAAILREVASYPQRRETRGIAR